MNKEMNDLINKLPEEVKNILVSGEDGAYVINEDKWQEALDKCYANERDVVIELFFRQLCEQNSQWAKAGITWDKVQPLLKVLTQICYSLGFKDVDNPFLEFLKAYLPNSTLSDRDLIKLNNMYANNILTYEEIHGDKFEDGEKSIVYNPELYNMNDVERFVKSYKFLSSQSNLKKMNWNEVLNANLSKKINDLAREIVQSNGASLNDVEGVRKARNTIIYRQKPSLNSQTIVDEVLKRGSTQNTTAQQQKQTQKEVVDDADLSKAISDRINNSTLTVDEKRSLINDIIKQIGLEQ